MRFRSAAAIDAVTDDELAAMAQGGDTRAQQELITRYRRFVRGKARSYFFVGADAEDVEQEGLIGLYKAIRDYRADMPASFRSFAELCVTRQIISAIKSASRQKHKALNHAVSISGVAAGEDGERNVEELLDDHNAADPADMIVSVERVAAIKGSVHGLLSELEVDVLRLHVAGQSYVEIGDQLGRHVKSTDNALQRIKRKLDAHFTAESARELASV